MLAGEAGKGKMGPESREQGAGSREQKYQKS